MRERDGVVSVVDPAGAARAAAEAGLLVVAAEPLNCETLTPAVPGSLLTPDGLFYLRNHFPIPVLDSAAWRLSVSGLVAKPVELSLDDLRDMATDTFVATLECAGNGRSLFSPAPDGDQWHLGAVSTAEWSGVRLDDVLDRAGLQAGATDLVFRGADRGTVDDSREPIWFERGLSLQEARGSGALLAYAMNGEPLPVRHGAPLRLVVPAWYAVASVKWLTGIRVASAPFDGYFQADHYMYERPRGETMVREPVRMQRVRALITEPVAGRRLPRGQLTVRGVAWSGAAPIARVEVSVADGGWQEASLVGESSTHGWQWWEHQALAGRPGSTMIRARATDLAGNQQPAQPEWNRRGYGGNFIHEVGVLLHRGHPAPWSQPAATDARSDGKIPRSNPASAGERAK
jgi:DMSO/TMAO reductase YedYZ molybdopterin-dependent catalytic subunit